LQPHGDPAKALKFSYGKLKMEIPWNPWLSGIAIGGGLYIGYKALTIVEKLVVVPGPLAVCAHCGSIEVLILIKDKKSKQLLIKNIQSNEVVNEIKLILSGMDEKLFNMDGKIEVKLTQIGAVIATNEEFSKLEKHMHTKLEKVKWKIENGCKGSLKVNVLKASHFLPYGSFHL